MKLFTYFNKERLLEIARRAENKQIVKDVNYAGFLSFHGTQLYCEWIEDAAFIIAQQQKSSFRIIGLCTNIESRGKGYAKFLLGRAEGKALEKGYKKIRTISKSGVNFYIKMGYDVIGIKHGDYILEKEL